MGQLNKQEYLFTEANLFSPCEMISISLEANRKRFYRLEIYQGLFSLILSRSWGRIGTRIRVKEEFYDDISPLLKRANSVWREKRRHGYQQIQNMREHFL